MKKKFALSFIAFVLINTLFSQTFNREKLDQYFSILEENNKFMGSVALSKNGEIIYQKNIGFCDVDQKIASNNDSKYRIGSITKTFTTVLVFKAIEEGKLSLDQPIKKYFPTIKNAKKITVKYLLGHRSGIHNFTDDESYFSYYTQATTKEKMIGIIAKGGSDFKPGTKAQYSNSNFLLLGYILENVYGKSYEELLNERIINVLDLENTYLDAKIDPNNNECRSYSNSGSWKLSPETDITVPMAAGALSSTPTDLNTFATALFAGKLISLKSLEEMKTLQDDFGLGLFRFPFYDKWSYGHGGRIDEFSSIFSYFPEDQLSFAMISNGSVINNNTVGLAVLSAYYNKPYELPIFSTFVVTEEDLKQYIGVYTSKEMPLKITIKQNGATLIAQATGQEAFSLEATEKDKFKFDPSGIVLEFTPSAKQMILKQGGGVYMFKME